MKKSKSFEELSSYTKEFFNTFLYEWSNFQKSTSLAFFCSHKALNNWVELWSMNSWKIILEELKLAMMDFRQVLRFVSTQKEALHTLYFNTFMQMFL